MELTAPRKLGLESLALQSDVWKVWLCRSVDQDHQATTWSIPENKT